MNALIHCSKSGIAWTREFFPSYPGYLLPLCNKPFLEFLIDLCLISGIKNIRLVLEDDAEPLRKHFEDGSAFGVSIDYGYANEETSPSEIIAKNKTFCRNSDTLFISGMLFLYYDRNNNSKLSMHGIKSCAKSINSGFYALIAKDDLDNLPADLIALPPPPEALDMNGQCVNSVLGFYQLNMELVYDLGKYYNLPGYGDDSRLLIGRAVEIPHNAEIYPPAIIGNTVLFNRNACIGPGAVIGDNVVVDRNAFINNSVVFGNTYIGANTELKDKICYRNILIEPESGVRLDIEDEFLFSSVRSLDFKRSPLLHRFFAFLLLLVGFLPFFALRLFVHIHVPCRRYFINRTDCAKIRLLRRTPDRLSLTDKIFLALSLDRYGVLLRVISGDLRLVGNFILEANDENAYAISQNTAYRPGLYSYSEYLGHETDPVQREIDELYYLHNASFGGNGQILLGILWHNLFRNRQR